MESALQDERERLHELHYYGILDTGAEEDFDALVELAAQITECPVASITFVDESRQWFKSRIGDPNREGPRSTSFCRYTIEADEPLIVEDPSQDPRFADNPDVTGGLRIGFYAGVPIYSPRGFKLGTVCVVDHQPRTLTQAQVMSLELIAKQVTNLLQLRLRNRLLKEDIEKQLQETESSYASYFENVDIPKWIYSVDDLKILQVNEAAVKQYGYSKAEFLKLTVFDIRDLQEKKLISQLIQSLAQGKTSVSFETVHRLKDGTRLPVMVTLTNMLYKGKKARLASMIDISENVKLRSILQKEQEVMEERVEEAKEQERDYLGKELHDNINQILASTKLFLEVAETNPAIRDEMIRLSKESVLEAINEIRALSRSMVGSKEEFNLVYSVDELVKSYRMANTSRIHFLCRGYLEELPDDVKLTMFRIIQEALSNTFKYAEATEVFLEIAYHGVASITLRDNGKGFDPEEKRSGIGINNIRHRVQFYNGKLELRSSPGEGVNLRIEIPVSLQPA